MSNATPCLQLSRHSVHVHIDIISSNGGGMAVW
eukprot:COSAG02_NODE_37316_length_443_cov_1.188953_1_plen_32_part_01